jgi:hypothetical protein
VAGDEVDVEDVELLLDGLIRQSLLGREDEPGRRFGWGGRGPLGSDGRARPRAPDAVNSGATMSFVPRVPDPTTSREPSTRNSMWPESFAIRAASIRPLPVVLPLGFHERDRECADHEHRRP